MKNSGKIFRVSQCRSQEETQDDEISYLDRRNIIRKEMLRAKISAFYGPQSCIGVIAMHRHFCKVHGQEDTVLSYVMPRKEQSIN